MCADCAAMQPQEQGFSVHCAQNRMLNVRTTSLPHGWMFLADLDATKPRHARAWRSYHPALRTSPPLMVRTPVKILLAIDDFVKCTWPSTKSMCAPPA